MSQATVPTPPKLRPSLDWLLVFVPICLLMRYVPALHNDTLLFAASCLAIIPLAGWLGRATEHLAEHVGEGLGGLLNATFGNAAELIISLMALQKGLIGVVKASITGSIIGNLLLVLGASLLAGGLKHSEQRFNQTAARASAASLTMAAVGLLIPSLFHHVASSQPHGWSPQAEQKLSLAIALVLIVTYGLSLVFSLKTHKQLYVGHSGEIAEIEDQEEGHAPWSKGKALAILLISTIFVALISEFLVGTIESARHQLGLTEVFVGVIVVAIVGNAAEHSSAILMAMKNKMDLTLGIANGSSQQIALFVAPVLVFASYLFGRPMDLEFTVPEIAAVGIAVLLVHQISGDGESNWLEGIQLLSVYIILGILFFFLPPIHHETPSPAR